MLGFVFVVVIYNFGVERNVRRFDGVEKYVDIMIYKVELEFYIIVSNRFSWLNVVKNFNLYFCN